MNWNNNHPDLTGKQTSRPNVSMMNKNQVSRLAFSYLRLEVTGSCMDQLSNEAVSCSNFASSVQFTKKSVGILQSYEVDELAATRNDVLEKVDCEWKLWTEQSEILKNLWFLEYFMGLSQ